MKNLWLRFPTELPHRRDMTAHFKYKAYSSLEAGKIKLRKGSVLCRRKSESSGSEPCRYIRVEGCKGNNIMHAWTDAAALLIFKCTITSAEESVMIFQSRLLFWII